MDATCVDEKVGISYLCVDEKVDVFSICDSTIEQQLSQKIQSSEWWQEQANENVKESHSWKDAGTAWTQGNSTSEAPQLLWLYIGYESTEP